MGSYFSAPKVPPQTTFTLTFACENATSQSQTLSYTFNANDLDFATKSTGALTFKVNLTNGFTSLVNQGKEEVAGTDGDFAKMRTAFVAMLRNVEGQFDVADRTFAVQTAFDYALSLVVPDTELMYTFLSSEATILKKLGDGSIFKVDPATQSMSAVSETPNQETQTDPDFDAMQTAAKTLLENLNSFVASRV